jgi:hypothetical protein
MTGRGVSPGYLLLLLLGQVLEGKVEVKQPPVASTPVVRVVASRGEEVQISCPVDGNPPPIIEWSKVGGSKRVQMEESNTICRRLSHIIPENKYISQRRHSKKFT